MEVEAGPTCNHPAYSGPSGLEKSCSDTLGVSEPWEVEERGGAGEGSTEGGESKHGCFLGRRHISLGHGLPTLPWESRLGIPSKGSW